MFAFLSQIFRPNREAEFNPHGVPAHLMEQASALAGHDLRVASELRTAALAALGVVR